MQNASQKHGRSPLIIYLDSQDFSHLAEPPPGKAEFYGQLDMDLQALIQSNQIEVRYSCAHVSEISHLSMSASHHSAKRAIVLNRLCAGRCLRTWWDILIDEIKQSLKSSHKVDAKQENNQWIDLDLSHLRGFDVRLQKEIQERLKQKGLSRAARRAIKKKIKISELLKTAPGQTFLDNVVDNLNQSFPITNAIDRETLAAYVSGTIKETKFLSTRATSHT